jgi:uncharacterized Tic20 family protein
MNETDTSNPVESSPTGLSSEERNWALAGHLSAFSGFVTSGVGCILGPLVVWLIKRDTLPFAAEQAKEALNFNITVAIAALALWIFTFGTFFLGLVLTVPLGIALCVAWFVLTIVAAIRAQEGVVFRYPFTLRLVK